MRAEGSYNGNSIEQWACSFLASRTCATKFFEYSLELGFGMPGCRKGACHAKEARMTIARRPLTFWDEALFFLRKGSLEAVAVRRRGQEQKYFEVALSLSVFEIFPRSSQTTTRREKLRGVQRAGAVWSPLAIQLPSLGAAVFHVGLGETPNRKNGQSRCPKSDRTRTHCWSSRLVGVVRVKESDSIDCRSLTDNSSAKEVCF